MGVWAYLSLSDYLIVIALLLILCYVYLSWNLDYFAKRNVPFKKPQILVGNMGALFMKKQSFGDYTKEIYNHFKEYRIAGVFNFSRPTYMIRDPELLKSITIKEFDHFMNRVKVIPDNADTLFNANLAALTGQKWRRMRNILSPAFTSSKMRGMFTLITNCGQQLVNHLESKLKEAENGILELDMKELFTKYTNDVIATSAFGISCDSLKDPNNKFYQVGKDITNFGSGTKALKLLVLLFFPKILSLLRISFFSKESADFMYNTIRETIKIREKNGIIRPDMIHLLMQARKGELTDEDEISDKDYKGATNVKGIKHDLSDTDITAQATIFFLAGFDTVATMLGFASILLAIHQDVQERLQEEIDETFEKGEGKITYEALHSMKYLDMVVSESLRIYPPAVATDRQCSKPFTVPATENTPAIRVDENETLFIPIYGFHHDPEYYPDPEKFDPERFSDENKHNIKPFTYMPFGIGPRSCIGNRFALMEVKIALVYALSKFTFQVVEKSSVPIRLKKKNFQMAPEKDFWLGITSRKHET